MNFRDWIIILSQLYLTFANPIYAPQFLAGGTGRNIRHLPCVSLRSGETGVCMFAFTCVKANGTHLGTCIDRFYFGSCCKLTEEADIYPQDNTIEEGPGSNSFVTTDSSIESNDIPDYFTRPKPISDKQQPSTTTLSSISQTDLVTTQSVQSETTTESHKILTTKPYFSTPYTTTQPSIALSTFQTLHNYSQGSSNAYTTHSIPQNSQSHSRPQKPSTTESTTVVTTESTVSKIKPTSSLSSDTRRPLPTETTKKPSNSATKPVTKKPIASSSSSTTSRPTSSTERQPPSTRFPPRNATTTRPVQITTRKPPTKKPVPTTKRPSSGTRKPVTTSRPSSATASTAKPSVATEKPFSSSVKVTQTTRPPLTSTSATKPSSSSSSSSSNIGSSTESATSQRPVTKRPTVGNADDKIGTTVRTTSRPSTTSRPRPSSKPTKISTISVSKPTTIRVPSRPQQQTTEKIKPSTSTTSSSTFARPSTSKPTTASAKPRPTQRPTKPTKPSRPTKPTKPSTTTSISTSSPNPTQPSTLSVTSIILNGTTLTNEILPPKVTENVATTEKVTQTTHSPGLVTWSSNSDDDVTKASETSATTPETTQEASTQPQWSPITTPDGWIMIQSLATEKPVIDDTTVRPKPTKTPPTSVKPTTESATTQSTPTPRPTLSTILSTIATVTTATDLPVSMEALNMSDYKQVCGRRLFPESRIVGGDDSSFGKWPWQISLRQWRSKSYLHKCGAALLNENWAITAAHCVENVPPSDLLLRLGEHDLANTDEPYGFQERRVQIVASHPQFDPRTFEYDLALLRFYEPLQPFQPNLLPICLPDDDENYVGHTAYVTGWGRLYEDGILPSVLQEVSVPVINNTMCEGMYRSAGYIEHIPHIFICAGWRKGGYDSCEGDSGGPMVIQRPRDKRWILAGVISWGIGCAEPNQPGVYTRISEFREWINQILQF